MATKKVKRITLLAGLTGGMVLLMTAFVFRDTFIELWSIHELGSSSQEERHAAAEHLGRLKSVWAIPVLLEAEMREQQPPITASRSRPRRNPQESLPELDSVYIKAILAPEGRALPPLSRRYKQAPEKEQRVIQALVDRIILGSCSTEELLAILEDDALEPLHTAAAHGLGLMGEDATGAIPRLCVLLKVRHGSRGLQPLTALRMIRSRPELTVPAVISVLDDEDPRVRSEAAFILGLFESASRRGVPALEHLLNDRDPGVVNSTSWALERINSSPPLSSSMKQEQP